MIMTIEGVAGPPTNGLRQLLRYAYTHEEAAAENRTDSVLDANHALDIAHRLCGDAIREGEPPREQGYTPLYVVQLQISDTHRKHSSYRCAYRKFDGCPMHAIEDMMEIYAAIKRVLRSARAESKKAKAAKKENVKCEN